MKKGTHMKKLIAILLVLSLFTGCQKKKNLVLTCTTSKVTNTTFVEYELFVEITWIISHNYEELISTSVLNTLVFASEEYAIETAETLRNDEQYETFEIEIDKNIVTVFRKNTEIEKISKEYIDEQIVNFESNGLICELE